MKLNARSLGLVGLCGALGGAANAWDVYCDSTPTLFAWHLVPAGALHGALLAVAVIGAARVLWQQSTLLRLAMVPVVSWVAGWLSYIPLGVSIEKPESPAALLSHLIWPFTSGVAGLWRPLQAFGLVTGIAYTLLAVCRGLTSRRLVIHLLIGIISGIGGSMWWWQDLGPGGWRTSLVHGCVWGALVGFGVWKAGKELT